MILNTNGKQLVMTDKQRASTLNNEEFIADLMMYSPRGALCQIFILEAIRFYSGIIIENGKPEDDGEGLISKLAWYDIAEDIQKKLEIRNNTNGIPKQT
jgi:hypothetical protein